jgi:ligand-binding sensor domain-containing protein
MMKRYIFLILCLLLLRDAAMAQEPLLKSEYSYRRYTTRDGLPSMYNEYLMQDDKGFIWICGASGLTCYDGFSFKNYLKGRKPNLYRMGTDGKGNIRALEGNQMYILNTKTDSITQIVLAQDNYLTQTTSKYLPVGYGIYRNYYTNEQALYAIRDSGMVKILEHPLLQDLTDHYRTYYDEERQQLYIPRQDTLWVVADKETVTFYPDLTAHAFCKFKDQIIILASDGIFRLSDGNLQCIDRHTVHFWEHNVKACMDEDETFYFSSHEKLYRYKDHKIEVIFETNKITDFIVDRDRNIWVVTYQGLYTLFHLNFRNYVLSDKNDNFVIPVYQPKENAMIAGTNYGKVFEIKDGKTKEISYPESPYKVAFFYPYGTAKDHAVYLPGPGDILRIEKGRNQWMNLPLFKTPSFVTELPDGNLLEGGQHRLIVFTPEGKVLKNWGKEILRDVIYAKPCMDANNRLWTGGYDGIVVYDLAADSAVKIMFDEKLKRINYMSNDREGNVWFGSENRLFRNESDTVCLEKTLEHPIRGIYFTRRNNTLIVASSNGIYIFDKDRSTFVFYNHENGYTGEEIMVGGAMDEDAEGNVYIPSLTGLFCFNPEELLQNQPKPKLYIQATASSIDHVSWKKTEQTDLKLNYKRNNVRIEYIGLSYTSAQNVRYRYRLLGFQNEWSEPTKLREITFNNLPPGNYTFEIYADSGTDASRSETQSCSFRVTPAVWQTAWFWVLAVALLVSAVTGYALWLQRRKNRKLIRLLETEKQLNELKISSIRLKAIPHFNANVLAAIEYYIMNRSKEDALRLVNLYSSFTYQTLLEVDKAARPLDEELAYVKMYLELEKIRFMDKFDFQIKIDGNVDTSVKLPNMILHTFAENAVKHGLAPKPSGGRIVVKAELLNEGTVAVSVEDNGAGREYAKGNRNVKSSKQGLDILTRQIDIYNSFNKNRIVRRVDDLVDTEGNAVGTRFSVEVPTTFNYEIKS